MSLYEWRQNHNYTRHYVTIVLFHPALLLAPLLHAVKKENTRTRSSYDMHCFIYLEGEELAVSSVDLIAVAVVPRHVNNKHLKARDTKILL